MTGSAVAAGAKRAGRYHHGNLRAALLDKAIEQLSRRGAEDLSLRALAREVGVSQTAPYRHFSDKEALLAAMATRGYRWLIGTLKQAGAEKDGPPEQLLSYANAYVAFAAEHGALFKLMFSPLAQPSARHPELREVSRQTLAMVQEILRAGMAEGLFREQDVSYLANAAWAGIHGVATLRVDAPELFRRHIELERQIRVSVDAFLNGIRSA